MYCLKNLTLNDLCKLELNDIEYILLTDEKPYAVVFKTEEERTRAIDIILRS